MDRNETLAEIASAAGISEERASVVLAGPEVLGRIVPEELTLALALRAAGESRSYRDLTKEATGEDRGANGSYWSAARALWTADALLAPKDLGATPARIAEARERGKLRFEEIATRAGISVREARALYAKDAERRGNDPDDSSIGRGTLARAGGKRADHGTAGKRRGTPPARRRA